jgi:hypothetical protein
MSKESINIGSLCTSQQHFGNPFVTSKPVSTNEVRVSNRFQANFCYEQWLLGKAYENLAPRRRKWILDNLYKLRGKELVCGCGNSICHKEILEKLVNERT